MYQTHYWNLRFPLPVSGVRVSTFCCNPRLRLISGLFSASAYFSACIQPTRSSREPGVLLRLIDLVFSYHHLHAMWMSQSAANWASPRGLQPSYIIPRPKKLAIVLNVFGSFPLLWVFLNLLLSRCFLVLPILRKRAGSGTLLISLISFAMLLPIIPTLSMLCPHSSLDRKPAEREFREVSSLLKEIYLLDIQVRFSAC